MENDRVSNEKLLVARGNKGCDIYQRMKNRIEIPAGKLKLSEVLEKL